jgi:hypothetical protein
MAGDAVERLARALHNANAAELAARGMASVEFPVDGRMEQEVVADWDDVAEPVRNYFRAVAERLSPRFTKTGPGVIVESERSGIVEG